MVGAGAGMRQLLEQLAQIPVRLAAVELTRFRGHIDSEHGRRDLRWRERIKPTRRSFASRWSSW